ncbi:MAG TPA: DinB family protein [Candidatus Limnocylindrales bacterium]|nr:DinB family protein [Candidatus Limnocylindrales bacterium]
MKTFIAGLAIAGGLAAQGFSPKMPDSVPQVTGPVVEEASLRYIDIQEGTGETAKPGQEYTVHYTGWLRDGKKFDSSVGKEPLKFVQGRRLVISGFDVGFEGMKVGGKRRIFIPYELAYGEQGRGSIPPKAELIFDVELVGVKNAPPAPPAAADLIMPLTETQEHTIALAKAVPADKYEWRPGPGVRSFKEVFLHIALGNELLLMLSRGASADEVKAKIASNTAEEKTAATKDHVVERLEASFAAVRAAMDSARANNLAKEVQFRGQPSTARAVLAYLDVHAGEHLGQAIAYARVNGIVPPWSN